MVWLMRSVTEREDALSAVSCLDILLQRGAKLAFFNIISPSKYPLHSLPISMTFCFLLFLMINLKVILNEL